MQIHVNAGNERSPAPKVIHIVENLDRGAVENWLVRMLKHARTTGLKVDWTFYCALGRPGRLDDFARQAGAKIIYSPVPIGQKWRFIRELRAVLRCGKYHVLHCHHDLISGLYLAAAAGLPIHRRLVHIHNADEAVLTPNRMKQSILRPLLRQMCLRLADRVVGISNHTLDTFLAGRPRRQARDRVHYYGIDPAPFLTAKGDRTAFRRGLGLPDDALILLFAGRLVPEKNPHFAFDVMVELHKLDPRAVGVFVGSGSEEQSLHRRAQTMSLLDTSIRFLGWRSDIADIMCCCDWFILPRPEHPMEGFGIAVVEAQLAGLRLLLSQGIAEDPLLPVCCGRRLSLADPASTWANAAMLLLRNTPPCTVHAVGSLANSPMDMHYSLNKLAALHND